MSRQRRPPRHSPLQKALSPGSQDSLHGPVSPPPRTPYGDDDRLLKSSSSPHHHHTTTTGVKRGGGVGGGEKGVEEQTLIDACLGPDHESLYTSHNTPEALEDHLKSFLHFRGAAHFLTKHGVAIVNQAIQDLYYESACDIRNPAAFLRWMVEEETAKGARHGDR